MMTVPMRFKGVEWRHNPREIVFECEKLINELKTPYAGAYVQNMGRKNMKIKGTGELFGEDCAEQFERLFMLFKKGGEGVLVIPNAEPVYAVFESLKIVGAPKPDCLTYSFVFREVMEKKCTCPPEQYICENGENLWDVSFIFDIPIDTLIKLNPWVKRPDVIEQGSVVVLC